MSQQVVSRFEPMLFCLRRSLLVLAAGFGGAALVLPIIPSLAPTVVQAQTAVRSANLLYTLTGHKGGVNTVAFTPFNHYAVSGSVDRTIRIWDLKTGQTVQTLNNSHAVNSITLSPDGNKIYGTGPSYKPSVKIWLFMPDFLNTPADQAPTPPSDLLPGPQSPPYAKPHYLQQSPYYSLVYCPG